MKRTLLVWTVAMVTAAAPALAQRGGGSGPKPQPPRPQGAAVSHGNSGKPSGAPKVSGAPKAPKPVVKTTKTTRTMTPKPVKSVTTVKTVKTTSPAKTSKTTTKTTKTTVASTTTLTPVQLKLQRNTNLASKLQSRLPVGTNLELAAAGFRNLGQFVAAVNVSNNLGIPFAELKTRMVDQGMSLGQAIQDARPLSTDTTVVVRRAETDADVLIQSTEKTKTKSKPRKATK